MKINLPAHIEFADYHEIPCFQDHLRKIIPGVKVIEVAAYGGIYHAIAYVGRKDADAYKKLFEEILAKAYNAAL
jgi:hypothetical protein